MLVVSCDTSLSKFAVIIWRDNFPVAWKVFRTGEEKCKKKLNNVKYFSDIKEQINWLSEEVIDYIKIHGKPDKVYLEGLAMNAMGNQAKNLAMIYGVFVDKLHKDLNIDFKYIVPIPPTQVKAVARTFLDESEQHILVDKKKKTVKMDKNKMMELAERLHPEILEGYVKSAASEKAGKEDLSDAILVYYTGKHLGDET